MLHTSGSTLTDWNAPPWASSELVDYCCIERRFCLGEIETDAADDRVVVEVVQRDELDITTDPISVTRMTPHVSVVGVWLRADQARALATALSSAADVVDGGAPTTRYASS